MEPFSIMMGYGLINSLSQLMIRPISDRLSVTKRQHEITSQMESKHRLDLEALRLNKQIEHDNQIDIQTFCHKCRIEEAQQQFERQLKMWQIGQFNDKMWPLLTPFDHPSLHPSFKEGERVPVNIFLAQTDPKSPFAILVQPDLKNRLSAFLQTAYASDPMLQHPTVCRIGDWKDGFQDAAFINALWFGLQGQPSIVVNPIQSSFGETLNLNISMWGLGENGVMPSTRNVMSGNFNRILGSLKREETKLWIEHGLPTTSPEMEQNRNLLEQEKIMVQSGHGEYVNELLPQYQLPREIQNKVISRFSSHYSQTISGITSMFADIYYLIEYGSKPYTPTAIRQYAQMNGSEGTISPIFAQHYHHALTTMVCTDYLQDRIPYAYLGVTESLNYDPDNAMQVFEEGVGVWANRKLDVDKDIAIPVSASDCVKQFHDNATQQDIDYLQQASLTLMRLNHKDVADEVDRIIKKLEKTVMTKSVLTDIEHSRQGNDICSKENSITSSSSKEKNIYLDKDKQLDRKDEETDRILEKFHNPMPPSICINALWIVHAPIGGLGYHDDDFYNFLDEHRRYYSEITYAREAVIVRRPNYFATFFIDDDCKVIPGRKYLNEQCLPVVGNILLTKKYVDSTYNGFGIIQALDISEGKWGGFVDIDLSTLKKRKYYHELEYVVLPQIDDLVENILQDYKCDGIQDYKYDIFQDNKGRYYKLGYQSRRKLLNEQLIMKQPSVSWKMFIPKNFNKMSYNEKNCLFYDCLHKGLYEMKNSFISHGARYKVSIERNDYKADFYTKADGSFFDDSDCPDSRRCLFFPSLKRYRTMWYNGDGSGFYGCRVFDITKNVCSKEYELSMEDFLKLPNIKDTKLNILRLDALCIKLLSQVNNGFTCNGELMKL